jgi:hypothetical protein
VIDTASTSQPPPWPSVGALLVSGWAGGVVATMLWMPLLGAARYGSVFAPGALTVASLAPMLGGVLVAAVLLPRLLRAFCEFELGLGASFVVALGRALASLAASMFFTATFRSPAMPTSATFLLLPTLLSLVVGYQLLKHLAQPVPRLARGDLAQAWLEEPTPAVPHAAAGEWSRLLPSVRIEVAQLLATLERAERIDVPGAVAEALPGLEALADRVEDAPPPSPSGHAAQFDLVAGIRSLQGALVDLAETAWRDDHRRELQHLRGLDEIHHALTQLESAR